MQQVLLCLVLAVEIFAQTGRGSDGQKCDWPNLKIHANRSWEYVYCGAAYSWNEANDTCSSEKTDGGKVLALPRIYDQTDVDLILKVIKSSSTSAPKFFLGLRRETSGSPWEWLVGVERKPIHWENAPYRSPPSLSYTTRDVCAVSWTDNSWEQEFCDASLAEQAHVVCGREVADDKLTCGGSPCYGDSKCEGVTPKTGGLQFRCHCQAGLTGRRCEDQIDFCQKKEEDTELCENGECQNGISDYRCDCIDGYEGSDCEEEIDECASGPCQNGAACEDLLDNFRCNCSEGFRGRYCAENIDECESNPCANHGSCIDEVGSYACLCADGFQGEHCQHPLPKTASPMEAKVLTMERRMAQVDKKIEDHTKYAYLNLYAFAVLILVVVAYGLGKIKQKACQKENQDYDRLGRSSNREDTTYTDIQGSQGSLASTPTYQSIPDSGSSPRQSGTPGGATMVQNVAHYGSTDISVRSQTTSLPPPVCRPPPAARRPGRSISTDAHELPESTSMNALQNTSHTRQQRRPSLPSHLGSEVLHDDYLQM